MQPKRNIAARAAHWSANHRKTAIWGWLAFVLIALALGSAGGMKTISDADSGAGESKSADQAINRAFPEDASETVLVQSKSKDVSGPAFRATIEDVVTRVSKAEGVRDVRSPIERGNRGQLAPDGHSALVEFEIAGDEEQTEERVAWTPRSRRTRSSGSRSSATRAPRRRCRSASRRTSNRPRPSRCRSRS
jgi:predicted RND superfamily exporter protein